MTAAPTPSRPVGGFARLRAVLALDGAVAQLMLAVFQYFVVSVSFAACLVPAVVFSLLIGWQPTHLSLWLGALSLLPLVPAVYALLRSSRRLLAERVDGGAGREFWRSFARGARNLAWAAIALSALVLLLGYDLALFGGSDAMLLFAAAAAAIVLALVIAVCAVAAVRGGGSPVELLTAATKAIARRPHVALSWLLMLGLGVALAALPVIGAPFALFLPALLGVGIHICNDALRFS
ncbi:hypothetical protein HF576_10555 [Microbacterium sp. CFH 90308]|uniref:DUF624 domain-containing protein n=1 Tax=Microbacterium salsuginis TaxID=2722803 RepID=A0ABX1KCQ7_9MICO|nr:hypothetical protein [Microbacterium sp. CFH 90308]NLP84292.1 hypothetical protein [Microbacterium sp. CFH 90308]